MLQYGPLARADVPISLYGGTTYSPDLIGHYLPICSERKTSTAFWSMAPRVDRTYIQVSGASVLNSGSIGQLAEEFSRVDLY